MTFGVLILLVFLLFAVLMFLRIIPALVALPLMAVSVGVIEIVAGTLTWGDLGRAILADGIVRLAEPMVIAMLGGMLSVLMQKTGVAESLVRRGAELSGDSPWIVSAVMVTIVGLLFTTIGGLGSVIMVGTVVLPIIASLGVREHIAGGIMVIGISMGGLLNAGNWTVYQTVLSLDAGAVTSYALVLLAVTVAGVIVFLTVELTRTRMFTFSLRRAGRSLRSGWPGLVAAGLAASLFFLLDVRWSGVASWGAILAGMVMIGGIVYDRVRGVDPQIIRWYAYAIPMVPLALILVFGMPFVPAFLCGLLFGIAATLRPGSVTLLSRAMIEGSAGVAPAIVLMMGIGMLLSAILGPTKTGPGADWHIAAAGSWPVLSHMQPLLQMVVPQSPLSYVLTFALLGPLALYRGPLNVWGLGYGIAGILLATGLPAGAVMGVLMSLGLIQGISDPTNTANVWVANEVRLDVTTLMWKTLPYAWGMAILGLCAGAWIYL